MPVHNLLVHSLCKELLNLFTVALDRCIDHHLAALNELYEQVGTVLLKLLAPRHKIGGVSTLEKTALRVHALIEDYMQESRVFIISIVCRCIMGHAILHTRLLNLGLDFLVDFLRFRANSRGCNFHLSSILIRNRPRNHWLHTMPRLLRLLWYMDLDRLFLDEIRPGLVFHIRHHDGRDARLKFLCDGITLLFCPFLGNERVFFGLGAKCNLVNVRAGLRFGCLYR